MLECRQVRVRGCGCGMKIWIGYNNRCAKECEMEFAPSLSQFEVGCPCPFGE